jgi:hypothetical protein
MKLIQAVFISSLVIIVIGSPFGSPPCYLSTDVDDSDGKYLKTICIPFIGVEKQNAKRACESIGMDPFVYDTLASWYELARFTALVRDYLKENSGVEEMKGRGNNLEAKTGYCWILYGQAYQVVPGECGKIMQPVCEFKRDEEHDETMRIDATKTSTATRSSTEKYENNRM